MPIQVKWTSAYAATAAPNTMTMIEMKTLMWNLSRPVAVRTKNSATGLSALAICRKESER
jgi:hypothetical protein